MLSTANKVSVKQSQIYKSIGGAFVWEVGSARVNRSRVAASPALQTCLRLTEPPVDIG